MRAVGADGGRNYVCDCLCDCVLVCTRARAYAKCEYACVIVKVC